MVVKNKLWISKIGDLDSAGRHGLSKGARGEMLAGRYRDNLALLFLILYNTYMKLLSTTDARKNIKEIVNRARYRGEVFAIGRRKIVDAVLLGFPQEYNPAINDITNVNTYSRSFDFLRGEPELYSASDLKKHYA